MKKTGIVMAGILCMAAVAHAGSSIDFDAGRLDAKAVLSEVGAPAKIILAGYVPGDDPNAGQPSQPLEWVAVKGGAFKMGTSDSDSWFQDAKPVHEVTVPDFQMSKTLVTVEQYGECVVKGACTTPDTGNYCNWGKTDRLRDPVNCLDWNQAKQYAKFKGARLPSESEYEYAATSGGKNQKYPWGNDDATSAKAVMSADRTMPVCSKPAGNAKVSGGELCDMVGNVWEWMEDVYQDSYNGTPADGSAFEGTGSSRVMRGGSFLHFDAVDLRADYRYGDFPGYRVDIIGFRLARSSR